MKSFALNGNSVSVHQLIEGEIDLNHYAGFEKDTLTFVKDWLTNRYNFKIKTSGSTGKPKMVSFTREQMQKSARRTLDTFDLNAGDTILSCLDPKYIAGLMMLVRAFEGELELSIVTPSRDPFRHVSDIKSIDFIALTPQQLEYSLKYSAQKLNNVKDILIGGADIHADLEMKLQNISSNVFHSYSMTETLTHVALRYVNGDEKASFFYALEGVSFTVDDRSCLIINDKVLGIDGMVTNDIVKLHDARTFSWVGRVDNVINTGGVKIQVEEVENQIGLILGQRKMEVNYCLVSQEDIEYSNKLVLLVEPGSHQLDIGVLIAELKEKLPRYHAPKDIHVVPKIIYTKSGKMDRKRNAEMYLRDI